MMNVKTVILFYFSQGIARSDDVILQKINNNVIYLLCPTTRIIRQKKGKKRSCCDLNIGHFNNVLSLIVLELN